MTHTNTGHVPHSNKLKLKIAMEIESHSADKRTEWHRTRGVTRLYRHRRLFGLKVWSAQNSQAVEKATLTGRA